MGRGGGSRPAHSSSTHASRVARTWSRTADRGRPARVAQRWAFRPVPWRRCARPPVPSGRSGWPSGPLDPPASIRAGRGPASCFPRSPHHRGADGIAVRVRPARRRSGPHRHIAAPFAGPSWTQGDRRERPGRASPQYRPGRPGGQTRQAHAPDRLGTRKYACPRPEKSSGNNACSARGLDFVHFARP